MKGWRTVLTNGGVLVLAIVDRWLVGFLPELDPATVAVAVTAINLVLRFITTTPVGDAGPGPARPR